MEISDVRKTSCAGMSAAGRVVQGTLDKIPYPDDAFDVVFSSEVLEHVPPNLAAVGGGLPGGKGKGNQTHTLHCSYHEQ